MNSKLEKAVNEESDRLFKTVNDIRMRRCLPLASVNVDKSDYGTISIELYEWRFYEKFVLEQISINKFDFEDLELIIILETIKLLSKELVKLKKISENVLLEELKVIRNLALSISEELIIIYNKCLEEKESFDFKFYADKIFAKKINEIPDESYIFID